MKSLSIFIFILILILISSLLLPAQPFTKITTGHLVTTPTDSRSVNFVDVNRDGWDDIFISNGLAGGENNLLYLNNKNETFSLAATSSINTDNSPSVGATFGDTDNDGDLDAYVTNWYGRVNQFYNGDSTGIFLTKTMSGNTASFAETASWGDYDADGFLDLYVTNSDGDFKNLFFRNLGNGSFTKIDTGLWVNETDLSRCVNWVDINDDNLPDLFVTNENNRANDLFLNNGSGGFSKVTSGAIVTSKRSSMSSSWGDIDNDGDQDLFVANAGFFQEQDNQLFLNDGGTFTEVTSDPVASEGGCSYGSNFGDYDNDGDLDLIVMNGFCNANLPNYLYENQGDGTFLRKAGALPNLTAVCSYGGAWGDINNDGFLDLVMANCKNNTNGQKQSNDFYLNNGNANNWLKVKLIGTVSNASAIGAKVRIKTNIQGTPTWQIREVSAQSGYAGQNSLVVHFGLGTSTVVDSLTVEWPSGMVTQLQNTSYNQLLNIVEGSPGTGLNEGIIPFFQLEHFPNPTRHFLNIRITHQKQFWQPPLRLVLTDVQGKQILEKEYIILNGDTVIQVKFSQPLAKGVYYLSAVLGEDSISRMVVIE